MGQVEGEDEAKDDDNAEGETAGLQGEGDVDM